MNSVCNSSVVSVPLCFQNLLELPSEMSQLDAEILCPAHPDHYNGGALRPI
jgi:hypothetical protein